MVESVNVWFGGKVLSNQPIAILALFIVSMLLALTYYTKRSARAEWLNNPDYWGEYLPLLQQSRTELEKEYDANPPETKWFFIEKKDGSKIGSIGYFLTTGNLLEIGYSLIPSERDKGYCAEAVKILVDYMFPSKSIQRIQNHTEVRNVASQKVLEKTGFKREGVFRKSIFMRGEWRNMILLYSILREEWKEPKILKRAT